MEFRIIAGGSSLIVFFIFVTILLFSSSCSQKTNRSSVAGDAFSSSYLQLIQSDSECPLESAEIPMVREVSLERLIDEIENYAPDSNVDVPENIFEMLKNELITQLREIAEEKRDDRFVSKAPMGDAGRITDLRYEDGMLKWTYQNLGDYDLSGEVGVADITPIALNFGAKTNDTIGDDAYESWIDGDGNGEVGVSDVTPIAQEFLNTVAGYRILTSDTEDGEYIQIGEEIPFGDDGVFPKEFEYEVYGGVLVFVGVTPLSTNQEEGVKSNSILYKTPANTHQWTMLGHDPQRTGRSQYTGPQTNELKWVFPTDSYVFSPVIADDGTVYFCSDISYLYAVNSDGSLKWKLDTGNVLECCPAIGTDGTVYVNSKYGEIFAVNSDGTLKWNVSMPSTMASSPVISDSGDIILNSTGGCEFICLKSDGTIKWEYDTNAIVGSSVAIGLNGYVYCAQDGSLFVLQKDGSLVSRHSCFRCNYGSPMIDNLGNVYFYGDGLQVLRPDGSVDTLYNVSAENFCGACSLGVDNELFFKTTNWIKKVDDYGICNGISYSECGFYGDGYPTGISIDATNTVYTSRDGAQNNDGEHISQVLALDSDGSLVWSYDVDSRISSSPAIGINANLCIGINNGKLLMFGNDMLKPEVKSIEHKELVSNSYADFTACVSYPDKYLWDFGGGAEPNTSTDPNPTVVLGDPGTYYASLTVSNTKGLSKYEFDLDLQTSKTAPVIHNIKALEQDSNLIFCPKNVPFIINGIVSGARPLTYSWNFSGTPLITPSVSTEESPEVEIFCTGIPGICSLTVQNEYGKDTFEFKLSGEQVADVIGILPSTALPGSTIKFFPDTLGYLLSYKWNFGNAAYPRESTENRPEVTITLVPGTYPITLEVSNRWGNNTFVSELTVE